MRNPLEIRPDQSPHATAGRLALIFGFTGAVWILLTDRLLVSRRLPRKTEARLGTAKGLGFVVVTMAALYGMSRDGLTQLERARRSIAEQDARIRQAYVEVLDAVTGGRLVLMTEDEMAGELGEPVAPEGDVASPRDVGTARATIRAEAGDLLGAEGTADILAASSEALDNAVKYGGSGRYQVRRTAACIQVVVADHGPGIDFRLLPKAALVPGFSTGRTLGMGFTIMLQLCARVLICSEPGRTVVVLERPLGVATPEESRLAEHTGLPAG